MTASFDGSGGPVGELVWVQLMISGCLEGPENQALEHFHDHGGRSDWSVVVQACYAGLLGNQHYGGGLEASWDVALLSDLNRAANTGASWSAHDLRVWQGTRCQDLNQSFQLY